MSCRFAQDDGAYVLGALSPAERAEFERHLAACDSCSRGVQELAGLPGLLARVTPDMLEDPAWDQVPETVLPALVGRVRRTQRRRTLLVVGAAAAATTAVVVGVLAATGTLGGDGTSTGVSSSPSAAVTAAAQEMTPVDHEGTWGDLSLTQVLWGTRLELTCGYPAAEGYEEPGPTTYAMVVRTRDGRVERVATWRGLPGKTMRLAAATATDRADIASVEVRTSDGRPVLRLRA